MQIVKDLHSKEPAWESPLNHLQGWAITLHNSCLWGRMSTASTFVCFQAWTWSLPLAYYSFTALAIPSCLPYTSFTPGLQRMLELLQLWSYAMRKHVVWSIRSATLHLNWCDSTRWFIFTKESINSIGIFIASLEHDSHLQHKKTMLSGEEALPQLL